MLNKISLSNLPLIPLISLITFTIIGLIYSLKFIKNQLFPNKKLKKQIINPPSDSILSLMKNTPLLYIKSLSKITGYNIYAKLENYLPFTSKDRMIKNIILTAEKNGKLNKNSTIYEGSSGNTAYSVAIISKILGYKCTIIIPDDCSKEKINLLKTTGCKIIITKQCPFSNFKDNYIRLAKNLCDKDPNGFYINQFYNKINYLTHYNETGPEIYNTLKGKIDCFISSAGTGGTITGISKFLKEKNPNCKIILSDINGSGMYNFVKEGVMFTKEESESNRKKERYYSIIEGIGNNFLNDNFNEAIIDESYKVSDNEALFMSKFIYENDGLFFGGSSSVNFVALYKMFLDKENNVVNSITKGANVVTVVYDSGIKYMSKLFNEENIKGNDIKNIEDIKL